MGPNATEADLQAAYLHAVAETKRAQPGAQGAIRLAELSQALVTLTTVCEQRDETSPKSHELPTPVRQRDMSQDDLRFDLGKPTPEEDDSRAGMAMQVRPCKRVQMNCSRRRFASRPSACP